ncbi:MAG: MlaE family lipid ABC transporter permease subunit [Helicobacteraceae bacterium]|nr:MlaE family lipid ABC transporter permease subunit [Candidatus Sulfurimonas ponti]
MSQASLHVDIQDKQLLLNFSGDLNLYTITKLQNQADTLNTLEIKSIEINLDELSYLDTSAAIFINNLKSQYEKQGIEVLLCIKQEDIESTLALVQNISSEPLSTAVKTPSQFLESFGKSIYEYYLGVVSFFNFLGNLFATKLHYLRSVKKIRYKEIAFDINESGIKALPIIALTAFLIGLVVAYQSAYQLKMYGANIFLVDMLGISILRELAPLITAIVIAGRSGSAFTAQIGAMKITEELDAMRTMGFDPYIFLVIPRILALMIVMPILIFVADIMGVIGGMLIANIDLQITTGQFLERFTQVVDIKHFYIGIFKGPFFAFLIASIGIYRGLRVKNDTQSIGFNTTKSVVESIFAVIVCDALFSIAFTNLGI